MRRFFVKYDLTCFSNGNKIIQCLFVLGKMYFPVFWPWSSQVRIFDYIALHKWSSTSLEEQKGFTEILAGYRPCTQWSSHLDFYPASIPRHIVYVKAGRTSKWTFYSRVMRWNLFSCYNWVRNVLCLCFGEQKINLLAM